MATPRNTREPSVVAAMVVLACLALGSLLGFASGCGGGSASSGINLPDLPPKSAVEALTAQPATPPELDRIAAPVESWTLSGPFPPTIGPGDVFMNTDADTWLVGRQSLGNGWVATGAMQCLARELGLYYAAHGGGVDPRLKEFAVDACGVVARGIQLRFAELGELEPGVAVHATLEVLLGDAVADFGPGDEVGAWLDWVDGQAYAAFVGGHTALSAPTVSRFPDGEGRVRLSGRFERSVERIAAYVTWGAHEVRECNVNAPLPDFSLDCPMADDDLTAVIEVLAFEPGRLLGAVELRAMAARPEADLRRYTSEDLLPGDEPTTRVSLVDAINTLRARAGQAPLVLESRQSEFQSLVAPHFFSAVIDDAPNRQAEADVMALGLIAGWDVPAQISSGRITTDWVPLGAGADGWLYNVQRSPTSRRVLFDPEATRMAVGTVSWESPPVTGFIVTTYIDLERGDPEQEAATIRHTLSEARQRAGQPAARRLRHERLEAVVADVAARLESGELDPNDALGEMMDEAGNTVRRGGFGMAFAAQRLDDIAFPRELIEEPQLNIIVGVAQVDLPGSPWAAHVVLLLHIGGAVQERLALARPDVCDGRQALDSSGATRSVELCHVAR